MDLYHDNLFPDTVGVVSLRVEHIENLENNEIKLDFLGKDSVRYVRTVKVDEIVYKNLLELKQNKDKSDDIFDKIKTVDLNEYLKTFMKFYYYAFCIYFYFTTNNFKPS